MVRIIALQFLPSCRGLHALKHGSGIEKSRKSMRNLTLIGHGQTLFKAFKIKNNPI